MSSYQPRHIDAAIPALLRELPALLIVGPRATGKTTTAGRYAKSIVHLDRNAEAEAFRADPDAALRGFEEPILLDEWQVVPLVLGAVKRAVDARPEPGRFLITGSVRPELHGEWWPGTGRVTRLPMYGMTIAEQNGALKGPLWLDRVANGDTLQPSAGTLDLRDYLDMALRSGFPEPALRLTANARTRWLDSYLDHLLTRDVASVDAGRDPVRLRRYLEAYVLNTAGVVDDRTLFAAAGIDRKTAASYERLLTNLMVIDALPAWSSRRLTRLVRGAKRHVIDAGLAGAALRLDVNGVLRQGDLLGRLLDTFVVSQLRAGLALTAGRPRLYHLRQQQGRFEVDIVAELGGGRLIGIEVKAGAAPTAHDARHLVTLRNHFDQELVAGVVLHTGPRVYSLADRIVAVPISSLWAA